MKKRSNVIQDNDRLVKKLRKGIDTAVENSDHVYSKETTKILSEGIKSMETDLKKFWHASSSETEEEVAHLQKSFFDRRPRTYYQDTDPVPVLQTI